MSVGTGLGGTPEHRESLAHGLAYSIDDRNPDHIVFIVTEKSKETVDLIEKIYKKEYGENLDYECLHINKPDNFNECFEVLSKKMEEYKNEKNVFIDYTSGTKTMSVSIALLGILYHKHLISISGKRGVEGTIISKTEETKRQNPYLVYDQMNFNKVKTFFNYNRFETSNEILKEIITLEEDKEKLTNLIDTYNKWDKFQHTEFPKDMNSKLFEDIEKQLKLNQKAMSIILKKTHNHRCEYILADLINNSQRRCDEGKYDDAIARLYRSLELIAQIRLKTKYNIKTSNVDLEILEKQDIDKDYLNQLKNRKKTHKIKIGLKEDYTLLKNLNDHIGQYYFKDSKEYENILNARNQSILAHGIESKTKEDYEKFKSLIMKMAKKLTNNNIELYIKETKFPKFKVD